MGSEENLPSGSMLQCPGIEAVYLFAVPASRVKRRAKRGSLWNQSKKTPDRADVKSEKQEVF